MEKPKLLELINEMCSINNTVWEDYKYDGNRFESILEKNQLENYKFKCEEQCVGEGQCDTYWMVFSVEDLTTSEKSYFRFNWYYDSFEGTGWQGMDLVTPREITVTVWDNV